MGQQPHWSGMKLSLEAMFFDLDGTLVFHRKPYSVANPPQEEILANIVAPIGAHPLLRFLKDTGLFLGVITWGDDRQKSKIDHLGFSDYFSYVDCSMNPGKPHKSVFDRAIVACGAKPENCLMVGDDPVKDIEGARAAGMNAMSLPELAAYLMCTDTILRAVLV